MKSEHRHELKTNELERIASDWGHASERYVHQHTNTLIAVAVVIVALVIGLIYWRMSAGTVDRQGWRALADSGSTADYGTVADKYAGTKVAPWARLREAEAELSSGIHLLFTDRDAGRSDLNKSKENFEKLIADKKTPPEIVERALFGLARCRESLPDKNSGPATIDDPAIETYERLLKEFPDTVYKQLAESRVAALRTGSAEDFEAWFERQNPKPADRAMPKDLSIPPLPEDFAPSTPPGSKPGSPPATNGAKKVQSAKGQPAAGAGKTPSAGKTSPGAGPASESPGAKSPENGPALPTPPAPAPK